MSERFQRLVREQKHQVFSFAYYFLGHREDAEDVAQDVLLRLWHHRQQLDDESVPAWLCRVTRNACLDQLRRRRTRRAVFHSDGMELAIQAPAPQPSPEHHAAGADFQRQLQRALAEVAEPYRSVVILREIHELKYEEISEQLEMPLNTVKTYLHRGRRLLRERLREVYDHVSGNTAAGTDRQRRVQ